jgi:hypothetical protein
MKENVIFASEEKAAVGDIVTLLRNMAAELDQHGCILLKKISGDIELRPKENPTVLVRVVEERPEEGENEYPGMKFNIEIKWRLPEEKRRYKSS